MRGVCFPAFAQLSSVGRSSPGCYTIQAHAEKRVQFDAEVYGKHGCSALLQKSAYLYDSMLHGFRLVQSVSTKIVFTCARRLVKEGKPSWARRSGENALAFLEFLSYPADGAGVLAQFPCSGTHFVSMAAS